MMEHRPDWVLSRQRAWGVPLTAFTRKGALPTDPDFLLRDAGVNARILAAFEQEGADAWYKPGAKARFLSPDHDPEDWEQVFDILDVWFDSGSTHAFVLRDRADGTEDGIADVYMEGTDQHRGWFHSSMLQACGTIGRAPYRNVVTHGFTLDEKGNKMSKSLGNTVVPEEVIKQYGADILRLWVAQADYTADQRIGPEILKGTADSYRRLRNTLRFLLGAVTHYSDADRVAPAEMPELERFMLHRLAELDAVVRTGYRAYDFQHVMQQLFNFCTVELSAFYFDIRKDALYCDGDTPRRRAARTVLDMLFHRLTTWMAPVLVFTMEEVWLERFPGPGSSVHLQDIPETPADWRDEALSQKWQAVRRARRVVTAALEVQRSDKVIGASLEAAPVVHVRDPETLAALKTTDFEDVCITSGVVLTGDPMPGGGLPPAGGRGRRCRLRKGRGREMRPLLENPAGCGPARASRCLRALQRRAGLKRVHPTAPHAAGRSRPSVRSENRRRREDQAGDRRDHSCGGDRGGEADPERPVTGQNVTEDRRGRGEGERPGDLVRKAVRHQPRRGGRADEHGDDDDGAHGVEGRHRRHRRKRRDEKADGAHRQADAGSESLVETCQRERPPEDRHGQRDQRAGGGHARQLRRKAGERSRIEERAPARRVEPDQAFEIAVKRMLHIQVHARGVGLLQQQHACGKESGKDDTHGGPRLHPSGTADHLDQHHGQKGRARRSGEHGQRRDRAAQQEGHHDAGQHDMRDGVADQRLSAQQQEVARQGAGHRRQRADRQRRQRERDELGAHQAGLGCSAASSAATWSGVRTVSIRVSPSSRAARSASAGSRRSRRQRASSRRVAAACARPASVG